MKRTFLQYFNKIGFLGALCGLALTHTACENKTSSNVKTNGIQWVMSLEEGLQKAKSLKKPLMIDFWAEWCGACKELDETTYADRQVIEIINKNFIAVKLDQTDLDEKKKSVLEKYNIIGLPTIVFLDAKGQLIKQVSATGYIDSKEMISQLSKTQALISSIGECKLKTC